MSDFVSENTMWNSLNKASACARNGPGKERAASLTLLAISLDMWSLLLAAVVDAKAETLSMGNGSCLEISLTVPRSSFRSMTLSISDGLWTYILPLPVLLDVARHGKPPTSTRRSCVPVSTLEPLSMKDMSTSAAWKGAMCTRFVATAVPVPAILAVCPATSSA